MSTLKAIKKLLIAIYLTLPFIFMATSCEDDGLSSHQDFVEITIVENSPNCSTGLERIQTFKDQRGIITAAISNINPYIIVSPEGGWNASGHLVPCNLPNEIQNDGLEIIFSGWVYEDIPGSSAVGVIFEFSEVKAKIGMENTP